MRKTAKQFLSTGCLVVLLVSSTLSFGQNINNFPVTAQSDTKSVECQFLKFETKQHENTVYIKWVVVNHAKESLFVVEHSTDGKEYKSIGLKEGAISPEGLPLMFSYIHKNIPDSDNYYRIKFFGETNQVVISEQSKPKLLKRYSMYTTLF